MSNPIPSLIVSVVLIALSCCVCFTHVYASLQCLDESGKPVDWYFIYKMPASFQFAYKDANDHNEVPLTLNAALLNRTETGSLGSTLHQIYQGKKSNDLSFALWNDDHPYEPSTRMDDMLRTGKPYGGGGGHTKGVLAVDRSGGFYLLHSVPKFPDLRTETFTWNASIVYAQSFLCLSLDAKNIAGLAEYLKWINPDFFDVHLPPPMAAAYPTIQELVGAKRFRGNHSVVIQTRAGKSFHGFGKSNTWGGDLYEQLVEPQLNNGFTWQTWRRGSEMPSMCAPPSSYASANILTTGLSSYEFSYTRDHSKWGVSVNKSGGWVCVGDINRMFSQRKRGGGTICFQYTPLWFGLTATIKQIQPC